MTVTVKNKKPLVVPLAVRRRAGLKSGQELEFKVSGSVITILPKFPAADDDTSEQRHIIDAGLDKADEDVKAGRVHGPFSTHREFITSLHQEAKKLKKRRTKRSV
jgi:bifunctional DNA-binding transcriptional regulator/antitoxin component of YhaV-PrlF toxin-antitoxin module